MSDTVKCETCEFWERMGPSPRGLCRRNAPTDVTGGCWPVTRGKVDWCGEHRPSSTDRPASPIDTERDEDP